VSFQYPDASEDVISDVSFTTHAGQMLGIIGSTGSGKSTLVQLIPRLYDATGGSVQLDGVDVRDMRLSELRRRVGYIPQQGMLFSGTVESNLKFAGDDITDDTMREAARVAQATDFIEERDGAYASPISQGGSNVSGGQRQRLAIARALAKHPEVIVFDDSFSALDYATDARLREELARSVTDAALVVVAQRIATIMHADEILVLDEGAVVGRGTHEELLRHCPTYLEIAQSQLSAAELGLTEEEIAATEKGGER
jgi:ATP-binding cassette subfamily B protein